MRFNAFISNHEEIFRKRQTPTPSISRFRFGTLPPSRTFIHYKKELMNKTNKQTSRASSWLLDRHPCFLAVVWGVCVCVYVYIYIYIYPSLFNIPFHLPYPNFANGAKHWRHIWYLEPPAWLRAVCVRLFDLDRHSTH